MLNTILSALIATILLFLSGIHFYWMLGGQWAFENALPHSLDGKKILNPKAIDCAIVGFGLLLMAVFVLIQGQWIAFQLPIWISSYGLWVLSGIFLLRAIGEFKYVGFSKTVLETDFARLDTMIYSPLCLFLGLGCLMIQILK
jgi:hypothetical protein